jgi:hypothetical protein
MPGAARRCRGCWRVGVEVYHPKDLDILHAIFAAPCLTTFCRLDELGLEAVGQRLEPDQVVIEFRVRRAAFTD